MGTTDILLFPKIMYGALPRGQALFEGLSHLLLSTPLGDTHCMEKKTEARVPVISLNYYTFVPSED